jgi:hypothetical protein
MNLLLESPAPVPYFTDVGATLLALGVKASEFDWYVSDIEMNFNVEGFAPVDGWITGSELERVLAHPNLQFIWGVFSAFPVGRRVEIQESPSADGNPTYWKGGEVLKPQLEGADFELVCWDSSATLLIGITKEQAAHFSSAYPHAKPHVRNQQ